MRPPQHADNLQEAQAQTTVSGGLPKNRSAKLRRAKTDAVCQILTVNVIVWLQSPGPKALSGSRHRRSGRSRRTAVELNNDVGPSPLLWITEAPVPGVAVALNRKPKRAGTAKKKAVAKPNADAEPKSPVPDPPVLQSLRPIRTAHLFAPFLACRRCTRWGILILDSVARALFASVAIGHAAARTTL